jgi:hypothetical protein
LKVFQEGKGYYKKIYDSLSTKEELRPAFSEAISDPKGKIDKIAREF